MSRHSYQPEMRRGTGRFAFSLLGGLFLTSQHVFPSPTFALSTRTARSADPPASQSLALSEVAVVRLLVLALAGKRPPPMLFRPSLCMPTLPIRALPRHIPYLVHTPLLPIQGF